jgi:hypothetical protein
VFVGVVPSQLAQDLKLPAGARFETLVTALIEVTDRKEDRRLLDYLATLAGPAVTSRRLDLRALAFPGGVAPSIDFSRLPLHTRTWNCLDKEDLLSANALQRQSLWSLLAIQSFGVKCLVDLLTAVEAVNYATQENAVLATPLPVLPPAQAVSLGAWLEPVTTLSPRLTREARLLGNEPWAKEVSLYDLRLGTRLLKDEESFEEVRRRLAAG